MDSSGKGTVEHAHCARIPKIHHFKSDLLPGSWKTCARTTANSRPLILGRAGCPISTP